MGIPFRQMHSWDYSGPYHGYDGFNTITSSSIINNNMSPLNPSMTYTNNNSNTSINNKTSNNSSLQYCIFNSVKWR